MVRWIKLHRTIEEDCTSKDDIEEVIPEVMDLDASEWNELVDYVQANFDLDTDPEDDTDVETKIEEALNAGVELLRLTQVIK